MNKNFHDRLVVILSDIEMNSGDEYDDFPHTEYLAQFIKNYNVQKYEDNEVDLIFNGDTFDFLKTEVNGSYPHLIDEEIGLIKLKSISKAHVSFFLAIEEFLNFGKKPRRVHFIVGNHDMEILFPAVQNEIISLCGGSGQILFPGFSLTIGDLYIEHGNQEDLLFAIDPLNMFIEHNNKKILNLPWATVTLLNVILPHRRDLCELDRIKPRPIVFEQLPSLKEFFLGNLWNYWTKDYIRSTDPLKKITWSMLKEALKRSFFFNADVEIGDSFHQKIQQSEDINTYVIGHLHDPRLWSYGNRKFIQAGCFRDEFMLEKDGSYSLINKSYIEVIMRKNKVFTSNLIEVDGPSRENIRFPKSLDSYVDMIKGKLGPAEKRMKEKMEIEAQEQREKQIRNI